MNLYKSLWDSSVVRLHCEPSLYLLFKAPLTYLHHSSLKLKTEHENIWPMYLLMQEHHQENVLHKFVFTFLFATRSVYILLFYKCTLEMPFSCEVIQECYKFASNNFLLVILQFKSKSIQEFNLLVNSVPPLCQVLMVGWLDRSVIIGFVRNFE